MMHTLRFIDRSWSTPHRWLVATVGLAFALFLCPPLAGAQQDADTQARVHFEQGNRLLENAMHSRGASRRRLLEDALAAYVASLRIVRSRNVLFNAGVTVQELGQLEDAHGYFSEYLAVEGLSADERSEGDRRLAALLPRVAVVAVDTEPEGAEVRVDRRDVAIRGRTPLEMALPVGDHTLYLTLPGYADAELQVMATVGQRTARRATLVPRPVPLTIVVPAPGAVTLDGSEVPTGEAIEVQPGRHRLTYGRAGFAPDVREIVVTPGVNPVTVRLGENMSPATGEGEVRIAGNVPIVVASDGVLLGQGREIRATVRAGRQTLNITADGHAPLETSVDVPVGEVVTLEVDMAPTAGTTFGPWPAIAAAGTAISAIVAVTLSLRAVSLRQEFEDEIAGRRPRSEQEAAANDVDSANHWADAFWITTAALGTTWLALSLLNGDEAQDPSTARVAVAPTPTGATFVARLSW